MNVSLSTDHSLDGIFNQLVLIFIGSLAIVELRCQYLKNCIEVSQRTVIAVNDLRIRGRPANAYAKHKGNQRYQGQ